MTVCSTPDDPKGSKKIYQKYGVLHSNDCVDLCCTTPQLRNMHRLMAHTLHILLLGLSVVFTSCDNAEGPKVPTAAGRGLGPAAIKRDAVDLPRETADPIVAWVNSETILESKLQLSVDRTRGPSNPALGAEQRRSMTLENLIDQVLVSQWLKEQPTGVSVGAVDAEVERLTQEIYGSRAELLRNLDTRQQTFEEFRHRVGEELAAEALLAPADVSETEIADLYREAANRPSSQTLVHLTSALLPAEYDRAKLEAVATDADFLALPGRHNSLGWVRREALGENLARAILAVEPPGRTPPMPTPGGLVVEVYWVHERKEEPTAHFTELEPILRRRAKDMAVARARADLVRRLRESAEIRYASGSTN